MTFLLLIRYSLKRPLAKKSPWASATWTTLFQKLLEELFPVSFLIHFSFLSIRKICHISVSLYILKTTFSLFPLAVGPLICVFTLSSKDSLLLTLKTSASNFVYIQYSLHSLLIMLEKRKKKVPLILQETEISQGESYLAHCKRLCYL